MQATTEATTAVLAARVLASEPTRDSHFEQWMSAVSELWQRLTNPGSTRLSLRLRCNELCEFETESGSVIAEITDCSQTGFRIAANVRLNPAATLILRRCIIGGNEYEVNSRMVVVWCQRDVGATHAGLRLDGFDQRYQEIYRIIYLRFLERLADGELRSCDVRAKLP